MSVALVGSIAFDSIKTPYGEAEKLLGGAATYSSISAGYFTNPYVAGIVGRDFGAEERNVYERHNIDITNIQQDIEGLSFHWAGAYEGSMSSAITLDTQLNVFANFDPQLNKEMRGIPYLFLANIDPTIQDKVLKQMKSPKFIAGDTMNFWIQSKRKELDKIIGELDALLINDGEVMLLTQKDNLILSAQTLLNKYGLKYLIVKKGENGSMLFTTNSVFSIPAYPLGNVVDPTGAGDTFAGGFMGYISLVGRTDEATIRKAMVVGTVMASFTVQGFGLKNIDCIDKKNIYDRIKGYENMIEVGVIDEF